MATILRMEQYYQVSRKALLVRLKELRLITNSQYNQFCALSPIKTAQAYGYNTSLYQSANSGLIISDYGVLAKSLFDNEKISEGHYIELLNQITPNNASA